MNFREENFDKRNFRHRMRRTNGNHERGPDDLAVPWMSSTAALTTNLEWNNYTILSLYKGLVYGSYTERWRRQ